MGWTAKSHVLSRVLAVALLPLFLGCDGDSTGPKSELKPLVGAWSAQVLTMTNQANPSVTMDLIEQGAAFSLSILSTGQYSAALTAFGGTNTEVGIITVSGSQVTITPTSPAGPPLVATWSFQGEILVLDGESEFDFNQDGSLEPAFTRIVLNPLGS